MTKRTQTSLLEWGSTERRLALRGVPCPDPESKLVLYVLEGHIDPEQGSWSMSIPDLADECGMSESTCRRVLDRLDTDPECSFIRWDRQRGKTPTFRILWENIRDAIHGTPKQQKRSSRTVTGDRTSQERTVTRDRTRPQSSVTGDRSRERSSVKIDVKNSQISYVVRSPVTELLYKDLTDLTDINRPPPPTDGKAVEAVGRCGVGDCQMAVATARSRGLTDAAILAIVAHFERFPGRWGAGGLHARLTKLGTAGTPADEAWPPSAPTWKPTAKPRDSPLQALEAKFGAALDALDLLEMQELGERARRRSEKLWLDHFARGPDPRNHPHSREVCLQLMATRAKELQPCESG